MKHGTLYGYRKGCNDDLACPATPSCRQTHNAKAAGYKARVASGAQVPTPRGAARPKSARHLKNGATTEFVRWVWLGEVKVPELVEGVLHGATGTHWQVEVEGRPVSLPIKEWIVCRA